MNFSRPEQLQELESKSEFDLLIIEVDTSDELYDEGLMNETY